MKLSHGLLLAALARSASAGPVTDCPAQLDCISWTATVKDSESCNLGGECEVEVCMNIDTSQTGCDKGGDSISHGCDFADLNGCPWSSDFNTPDGSGKDTCTVGGTTGQGATYGDDKCDPVGPQLDFCAIGKPGATLRFVLKDGNGKGDTFYEGGSALTDDFLGVAGCTATVECKYGDYSCGNVKNQKSVERVWSYTIPEIGGSCDYCSSSTPPPTVSTPPPTVSTPPPTAHYCQGADYISCDTGKIQICLTDSSMDVCYDEADVVAGMAAGELAITCGYCPTPPPTVSTPPPTVSTPPPTSTPETGSPAPVVKPSPSGSLGDPHFKTWQNEHFEYHGQCDLVLTKDPEFADGLGIDVQIRTKLVRHWSYIKQAAIRIGDDILEVTGSGDETDRAVHYWMNLEYQGELSTIGGFPITLKKKKEVRNKRWFTIDLSSKYPGVKIVIQCYREFVRVDFEGHNAEAFGNTVGMLGDYKSGKTLGRDGLTLINDFTLLGNEWQLLPTDDMLFHDISEPQFPKKCIEPEDPQGERRRRLDEMAVTEEQAEAACASISDPTERKDCIYDIIATQDLDMVGAY